MTPYRRIAVPTSRLILVAATVDVQLAELADRASFASHLDAEIPTDWPPLYSDENSMRWVLEYMRAHPEHDGWTKWYFLLARASGGAILIGNGGFAGAPADDGTVEVGYSVAESHQRQGYAPEAVRALVAWAFAHPSVTRVVAHTMPELRPSIRVLEKCGFRFVGDGAEAGTIRFELSRPR